MFWQGVGGPVAGRNGGGCTGCAARARGPASRRFGQAGGNRITAIDTSVLLLIQKRQAGWADWKRTLNAASREGPLVVCPVVFAEFSPGYSSWNDALHDLDLLQITYETISPEAAWLAGHVFLQYRKEGGPRCTLIPDFLIAAHASVQADRLAALDRGYVRRYFPALRLLVPSLDSEL